MYEETGNKSIALAFNKGNWGLNDLCFRKNGEFNSDCLPDMCVANRPKVQI